MAKKKTKKVEEPKVVVEPAAPSGKRPGRKREPGKPTQ